MKSVLIGGEKQTAEMKMAWRYIIYVALNLIEETYEGQGDCKIYGCGDVRFCGEGGRGSGHKMG